MRSMSKPRHQVLLGQFPASLDAVRIPVATASKDSQYADYAFWFGVLAAIAFVIFGAFALRDHFVAQKRRREHIQFTRATAKYVPDGTTPGQGKLTLDTRIHVYGPWHSIRGSAWINFRHNWIQMIQPKPPQSTLMGEAMVFHYELEIKIGEGPARPLVMKEFKQTAELDDGTKNTWTDFVEVVGL